MLSTVTHMGNLIMLRRSCNHTSTLVLFTVFNPIALRKAKIVCNFGLSECRRVKLVTFISHNSRLMILMASLKI